MTRKQYPELDETLYRETLENGLTVLVVPRKGFTKKLAYFVTDFGSIHTDFRLDGKEYHAPAGVAHYLEHKMFDLPGDREAFINRIRPIGMIGNLGRFHQRLYQLRHDGLLFFLHRPL